MRGWVFAASILTAGSPLMAAESCATLDPKAVAALFDDWNFSLSSLEASQVVQRYWPNAVLLPTVSNTPRTNAAMIGDYFEHFVAKRPRGRIDTRTIQGGCNVAMDVGTYTFSLMDDKGVTSEVAARYTFIYQYRDGAWKILHHHSSAMPESAASAPPVVRMRQRRSRRWRPSLRRQRGPQSAPAPVPVPVPNGLAQTGQGRWQDAPKPADHAVAPAAEQARRRQSPNRHVANLASSPPPSKFYTWQPSTGTRRTSGLRRRHRCRRGHTRSREKQRFEAAGRGSAQSLGARGQVGARR
jgi:uncharacterized protein (TIGR02246 family)